MELRFFCSQCGVGLNGSFSDVSGNPDIEITPCSHCMEAVEEDANEAGYTRGKIVNLQELTQELRLPREWLRNEAEAGRIPCLRVGHHMLFCVQDVQTTLAQRAAGKTAGFFQAKSILDRVMKELLNEDVPAANPKEGHQSGSADGEAST